MTQSLAERLQSLSLPDVSRDDIARGLSGIPTPDLSSLERPSLDLPDFDLRKPDIDLGKIDLPNAVLGVATAVGLKRASRPRWPFALGAAAVLVAGAFVALNRRAVQARLQSARIVVERQVAQLRYGRPTDDAVAFTAAATAPIEPSEFAGVTGADYPDGLGNGSSPAIEDGASPETRSAEVAAV